MLRILPIILVPLGMACADPQPGRPGAGSPTGDATTSHDIPPDAYFLAVAIDGTTTMARAQAMYVVRSSGPDCVDVETLLIDASPAAPVEEPSLFVRLEAATMATGSSDVDGTRDTIAIRPWEGHDTILVPSAWTVEALGDDMLTIRTGPGLSCPHAITAHSDNSDCAPYTEASLTLLPSPAPFEADPLCQDHATNHRGNCFVNADTARDLRSCP